MTGDVGVLASGGCHIFSGCGFPAPGLQDFEWKPLFSIGSFDFTKPMLLAILAALVVIGFFWLSTSISAVTSVSRLSADTMRLIRS